jgi:hypothetical protein
MNSKNKKIVAIGGVSLAAVAALAAGSFAFFTDSTDKKTSGVAGSVDIDATDLSLSNAENINPGDEDETKSADARVGTDHDLTFTVSNTGNKSIMTRNVITLSVANGDTVLDPSVYSLKSDDDTELVTKYYSADGVTFSEDKPDTVKYVRYVTTQVALNGVGEGSDNESNDAVSIDTDAVKTNDDINAVDYDYILKLAKETPDGDYELSTLNIEVEVQAMQYRNTTDAEWETLFADTLTIKSDTSSESSSASTTEEMVEEASSPQYTGAPPVDTTTYTYETVALTEGGYED